MAPFMDLSLWRVLYERGHLAAKIAGVTKGYVRRLRDLFSPSTIRSDRSPDDGTLLRSAPALPSG